MVWVGQNSIAYLSLLVIYVCLRKEKNLTLKTCAPDFSACSMTKLYAKIKGACAVSLFDFLKTWQVWKTCCHSSLELSCHDSSNEGSQHVFIENLTSSISPLYLELYIYPYNVAVSILISHLKATAKKVSSKTFNFTK